MSRVIHLVDPEHPEELIPRPVYCGRHERGNNPRAVHRSNATCQDCINVLDAREVERALLKGMPAERRVHLPDRNHMGLCGAGAHGPAPSITLDRQSVTCGACERILSQRYHK